MVDAPRGSPRSPSIRRYARPRQNRGSGLTPCIMPECSSFILEAVADSGPGGVGGSEFFPLLGLQFGQAAYFFLDRRGLAIVLMVRMFAFEV